MTTKTIITLKRFYSKKVEIKIDPSLLKGKTEEQIVRYLREEYPYEEEDELFEKAKLETLELDHNNRILTDTDRYDIYENGEQVYGGHL
jgi:hypothetical protein